MKGARAGVCAGDLTRRAIGNLQVKKGGNKKAAAAVRPATSLPPSFLGGGPPLKKCASSKVACYRQRETGGGGGDRPRQRPKKKRALLSPPRSQKLQTQPNSPGAGAHLATAAVATASATPLLRQSTAGLMRSMLMRSLCSTANESSESTRPSLRKCGSRPRSLSFVHLAL